MGWVQLNSSGMSTPEARARYSFPTVPAWNCAGSERLARADFAQSSTPQVPTPSRCAGLGRDSEPA